MSTPFLGLDTVPTNSTNPSVPVNDAIGAFDAAVAGHVTIEFTSDANMVLTPEQALTSVLALTDSPATLTTVRDVVFPAAFPGMLVINNTAQTLTLKKSGQTGVTVAAGSSKRVNAGASDVVAVADASGVSTVNGSSGAVIVYSPIIIACSDETTALTAGTAKVTFRMPYAFTVAAVRASLSTAQTSGSILTVDINEGGVSILSTKLTIDNTEKTSTTAATPAVISDASLADDAEITIDIDQIGDGTAKGLKVMLIGYKP